jgi:hypothetical protein
MVGVQNISGGIYQQTNECLNEPRLQSTLNADKLLPSHPLLHISLSSDVPNKFQFQKGTGFSL